MQSANTVLTKPLQYLSDQTWARAGRSSSYGIKRSNLQSTQHARMAEEIGGFTEHNSWADIR
jgi:hypothetical protein